MGRGTSLRSRRQRKAWGEAKRNPRLELATIMSPRSGRKSDRSRSGDVLKNTKQGGLTLSPAFAGSKSFFDSFLGLAPQALC